MSNNSGYSPIRSTTDLNQSLVYSFWSSALWHVLIGTVLLSCIGSTMHFAYAWTGCHPAAALPFAVNESVYEHMKIMLFPILVWWLCCGLPEECVIALYSAAAALLLGDALLVGLNFACLGTDITLFVLSIGYGQYAGWAWLKQIETRMYQWLYSLLLLLMIVMLCACTYSPPHTPLFADPNTHAYGRPVNCTR